MKKTWVMVAAVVLLSGCAAGKEKLEMYTDNPEFLIKDPHFADYQQKLDDLESDYLAKKITYADYLDKKKELDDQYTRGVKKTESIVIDGQ